MFQLLFCVFEKGYNFPSLNFTDKFTSEKKHLSEIASAKEMQKDGINLSEMNIKLLQKVQELILYLIEMKKENMEIKRQNHAVKNENYLIKKNEIEFEKRIKKLEKE